MAKRNKIYQGLDTHIVLVHTLVYWWVWSFPVISVVYFIRYKSVLCYVKDSYLDLENAVIWYLNRVLLKKSIRRRRHSEFNAFIFSWLAYQEKQTCFAFVFVFAIAYIKNQNQINSMDR